MFKVFLPHYEKEGGGIAYLLCVGQSVHQQFPFGVFFPPRFHILQWNIVYRLIIVKYRSTLFSKRSSNFLLSYYHKTWNKTVTRVPLPLYWHVKESYVCVLQRKLGFEVQTQIVLSFDCYSALIFWKNIYPYFFKGGGVRGWGMSRWRGICSISFKFINVR